MAATIAAKQEQAVQLLPQLQIELTHYQAKNTKTAQQKAVAIQKRIDKIQKTPESRKRQADTPMASVRKRAKQQPSLSDEDNELVKEFSGCETRFHILCVILDATENYNQDRAEHEKLKVPILFPERHIKTTFITIDRCVMDRWKIKDETEQNELFRTALPTDVQKKMLRIGGELKSFSTDGVSMRATVTFSDTVMPKLKSLKKKPPSARLTSWPEKGVYYMEDILPEVYADQTFECYDPGVTALYTGDRGTEMPLTEYRAIACHNQNAKQTDTFNRPIKHITDHQTSIRAGTTEKQLEAFKERVTTWTALWSHFTQKKYAKSRFTQSIRKRRAVDISVSRLLGQDQYMENLKQPRTYEKGEIQRIKRKSRPKNILTKTPSAVIGSAMFSGTWKRLGSVPVVKLKEEAGKKGVLLLVDEHRTSIACSTCKKPDENMHNAKAEIYRWKCEHCHEKHRYGSKECAKCGMERKKQMTRLHKVLVCKTCNNHWDRDRNACFNIRQVVDGYLAGEKDRPVHLRYKKKNAGTDVSHQSQIETSGRITRMG